MSSDSGREYVNTNLSKFHCENSISIREIVSVDMLRNRISNAIFFPCSTQWVNSQ